MTIHIDRTYARRAVAPRFHGRRRRRDLRFCHRRCRERRRARSRGDRQDHEPVGDDLDRRHRRDHVAGGRDGAGVLDLAAAHPRRGARRRLGEGAHRRRAAERRALQESGLRLHVHRRQQCRDLVLQAAAPVRRAGPQGAAGERREALERAGRGAHHRAERGGACQERAAARLRRDRRLRRSAGQGPGGRRERAQEAGAVPPHRQGCDAHRAAAKSQRQRAIQHRRPGARHALRRDPARAGGRRRARTRSTTPAHGRCPACSRS